MVLMSDDYAKGRGAKYCTKSFLYRFKGQLMNYGIAWQNEIELIVGAKVPLVKFIEHRTGLKVDMSFENSTGLTAINTFKAWREQYPGMPALVTLIKHFLLMRGLNEPVNGGIGGFSVICLVVSMLQMMPEVQSGNLDTRHHLGQLLLQFFDLYGNKFNYETVAISMDPPRWIPKVSHHSFKPLSSLQTDMLTVTHWEYSTKWRISRTKITTGSPSSTRTTRRTILPVDPAMQPRFCPTSRKHTGRSPSTWRSWPKTRAGAARAFWGRSWPETTPALRSREITSSTWPSRAVDLHQTTVIGHPGTRAQGTSRQGTSRQEASRQEASPPEASPPGTCPHPRPQSLLRRGTVDLGGGDKEAALSSGPPPSRLQCHDFYEPRRTNNMRNFRGCLLRKWGQRNHGRLIGGSGDGRISAHDLALGRRMHHDTLATHGRLSLATPLPSPQGRV